MKKLTCFARPPKFMNRMIMMIIGIMLQGFGLALLIDINLGTDPCTCLTQGVIKLWAGITGNEPMFGTVQLLCHLVTFLFVIIFDMSLIGFGTIGNMVCLGYISDFWRWVWSNVLPEGTFTQEGLFANDTVRYILLVPVLVVFIVGAATYMTAGLGTSPYDGLPFIISKHVKRFSFKVVRMIWDISFMLGGLILGGDVWIVTIVVAFFLGPVITWIGKRLERFITA